MNLREKYNIPQNAVITIAGTVGVGKSTMTSKLAEALQFKTSFENVDHNPYLDKFYADFERWSFHLQIYFLAERFKEQKRMYELGGGFVQDRSIYEDTGIFAKMHADKGTMNKTDYATYTSLFEAMVMTPYFPHPDVLLYLEGDLNEVITRIHKRGRDMEQQTPISYWEEMHERYQTWINQFTACPVLRLNIKDYDLLQNEKATEEIIAEIAQSLKQQV
ncbi:deoxycytidine kinase [Alkalihalobacillus alcalophilus ATCC 27647 = CGMCC 1.3604]|uniref:Deoxycytidine kinase n=1 Tax=Alkalihalobacillus alcalophilus ATCC 27647 = CGMCC 1.3604 TaxID=1218173 RepID=A0A094WRZ2_ALKAL|nr:deoxynucleoside kinase [Alkalihalobacillus alcalophilus]KGA98793.1 deoxycytidine kinase [Alkalihalobacillus alcalophilus ATCC 27647 = CGMCC 1.3604]MED1560975.1 deoxynucleoside kinase [Alkalihalobacillus alcalophilus]THG88655.1 deoxycytidine kinase [Alkalihalobacillus alcalophilus ATCC 27647 = CGMCC 1.3604]